MSQRKRGPSDRPTPSEAIMVVEPHVLIRMTISDYLRGCGYKVLEATGSREALRILEGGFKVHAVFAATKLEGQMDGFALPSIFARIIPVSKFCSPAACRWLQRKLATCAITDLAKSNMITNSSLND